MKRRPVVALVFTALLLTTSAARADETMSALARWLAEDYALPRYAALAEQGQDLATALTDLCSGRSDKAAVQQAYHRAMDAWMAIQHLRFGPVDYLDRHSRLYFWPDKTNALGKQLPRALNERSPHLLEPTALAKASVALQGLPALERLLFSDKAPVEETYGCAFAQAIGANVAGIAAGVLHDWRDGESAYARRIIEADANDLLFSDSKEVAGLFFAGLHEALRATDELRLGRPLGEAGSRPRPRRAESWRSGRSLRNITVILESLASMTEGFASLLRARNQGALADRLSTDFAQAIDKARAIQPPLSEAVVDPIEKPKTEALRDSIRALHVLLATEVSPALDLWTGFNSLDGD